MIFAINIYDCQFERSLNTDNILHTSTTRPIHLPGNPKQIMDF